MNVDRFCVLGVLLLFFAEDVPDVVSTDIHTGAYSLFISAKTLNEFASADWDTLCPKYNAFVNSTGET
jgi:hypothetical protein